jgi:hypothetical protein
VIVCLVPVLGRPQNAAKVAHSLRVTSPKVRLMFICSASDTEQYAACAATHADVTIADWEPGRGDFAKKIELGYRSTQEPWIFQGADDISFEKGWDEAVLRCANASEGLVIGTHDGGNPSVKRGNHSTHTLIARSYCDDPGASFDGPGTVFSTAYDHQSVDVELIWLAKKRGVWAFCEDAKVIHHHPFWDRSVPSDATYKKGLAGGRKDIHLFQQRLRRWRAAQ